MRAFTAVSLIATAAFSIFASAAPIGSEALDTVGGVVGGVVATVDGVVDDVVSLKARDDLVSVPVILTDLTTKLGPVVGELGE